jgi:uridylate kinase
MDTSAVALMRENKIPIIVFSLADKGGFDRVMAGKGVCTIIGS